jgi:hypothetical protein
LPADALNNLFALFDGGNLGGLIVYLDPFCGEFVIGVLFDDVVFDRQIEYLFNEEREGVKEPLNNAVAPREWE